jgi:chemotaxis protein MotB
VLNRKSELAMTHDDAAATTLLDNAANSGNSALPGAATKPLIDKLGPATTTRAKPSHQAAIDSPIERVTIATATPPISSATTAQQQ